VLRDLARHAARECDEALGVRAEQAPVDAGLVVEALDPRERREAAQVLPAAAVARKQRDVMPHALLAGRDGRRRVALDEVGLAAEDRVDARLARLGVELDRPEEVAVVGERQAPHAVPRGLAEQRVDADRAVEQREVAVDVEVGECRGGHARAPTLVPPGRALNVLAMERARALC
jgi:hypothetical protein